MPMIYVRAKPGRRAYFEGKIIPDDKFVPVTDTPYIRRLIHHWEDVELQGGSGEKKPPSTRKGSSAEPAIPRPGANPIS